MQYHITAEDFNGVQFLSLKDDAIDIRVQKDSKKLDFLPFTPWENKYSEGVDTVGFTVGRI